jgi:hypothetical protein
MIGFASEVAFMFFPFQRGVIEGVLFVTTLLCCSGVLLAGHTAFLRGIEYQEYELHSAADAMPVEKYGYAPRKASSRTKSPMLARRKSARSLNR